ncbi:MAG: F0F1 ATP synthase subunit A [Saccharofermentanales bacterium]
MYYFMAESYFTELIRAIKQTFMDEIAIGDIGVSIREAISSAEVFAIRIGGVTISISEAVVATWIVMAVITVLAIWMGRNYSDIPRGKQTISEGIVGIFVKLCEDQGMTPEQTEKVAPYVGSLAIFICLTNTTSTFKLAPPAKDPIFPITLALFTIGYVIFTGIRFVGLKGMWASLTYPQPALFPFKLLDYIIKPISLSLRLFGNIFGAFILMEFIYIIFPAIIPGILGLWFDLADGILQGVVFSYLTIIYVGEILEGAKESEEKKRKALPA